jgi:hypothetical protein
LLNIDNSTELLILAEKIPDGFYSPQPHSLWVLIVGVLGISMSIILLLYCIFKLFQEEREKYAARKTPKAPSRKKLQQKYMDILDSIQRGFENLELTEYDVYYEIAQTLRLYASEKNNENYTNFTLRDLSNTPGLALLHETIDFLYDCEFFDHSIDPNPTEPNEAIEWGRNLVRRW